ncbi:uncharacterized protein FTOL_10693 [Fusarium torulosum]|uniref:Uncharacterized protein n=1 Tax=Fusarium torulosum TaxID=33205 RepID=A0AAE8SMJ6_9HYPO|nr:uncharacterized protein FTOL_10693 [Fusarium torulosum]
MVSELDKLIYIKKALLQISN